MNLHLTRLGRGALLLATLAFPALAQQGALQGSGDERPWARGVPKDLQREAEALFKDGNAALKESLFVKAAQKYREALQRWDHPAIHYNLALALVNLDQPVETLENLDAALAFGPAPLDNDKFEQAQRYKNLIEKQLARLKVTCLEPGAVVRLDGKPVLTGPGSYEAWVRAGPHTLTASKEGFLPGEQSPVLVPGKKTELELKLVSADSVTEYRTLMPVGIPWAVLLSGVVVAGAGAAAQLALAQGAFDRYDRGVTDCSRANPTGGCLPSVALAQERTTGQTMQSLAYVGYAVGGAAAVAGGILLYLNRPQPYRAGEDRADQAPPAPQALLLPTVGPGYAGASLTLDF